MNCELGPSGSEALTSFSVRSKELSGCSTPRRGPGQQYPVLIHVTLPWGDGVMCSGTALLRATLPHLTRLQRHGPKPRNHFCRLERLEASRLPSEVWRESPQLGGTAAGLQETEA